MRRRADQALLFPRRAYALYSPLFAAGLPRAFGTLGRRSGGAHARCAVSAIISRRANCRSRSREITLTSSPIMAIREIMVPSTRPRLRLGLGVTATCFHLGVYSGIRISRASGCAPLVLSAHSVAPRGRTRGPGLACQSTMMVRRAERGRFAERVASLAECLPRRAGTRLHCACVTRSPRLSCGRGDLLILIGLRCCCLSLPLFLSLSLSCFSVAFYFTRR